MTLHHDNLILLQYHIPKTKLLFSRRCADRLIHVLKIWLMPIRESCWDQRIMASKCQFCLTPQADCKTCCHHSALFDPGRAVRSAVLPSASSGLPARRSHSPDTRCQSQASSSASQGCPNRAESRGSASRLFAIRSKLAPRRFGDSAIR